MRLKQQIYIPMNEGKNIHHKFLTEYEELELPAKIRSRFIILERLASHIYSETYKLKSKRNRKLYILKIYPITPDSPYIARETAILYGFTHKGLPKYLPEIIYNNRTFILREYIEGITLDEYIREHPHVYIQDAARIMISLCEILAYLHNQPEPVIHRDIKPGNIIINPKTMHITLIDFDIARIYKKDAIRDTVFFGTREFAPPEQYGFFQTDWRSDIYPLGIIIRYMMTGEMNPDKKISNPLLERIAQKCSAFEPKNRFQSAAVIKKVLEPLIEQPIEKYDYLSNELYPVPEGYDENDYKKMAAFLLQGINLQTINIHKMKGDNGQIIDLKNPETWHWESKYHVYPEALENFWGRLMGIFWQSDNNGPKKINTIQLHEIGLSGNLDVSGFEQLELLHVSGIGHDFNGMDPSLHSSITSINVSNCVKLHSLGTGMNKIKTIDVSDCVNLKELLIWGNELSSLDVSRLTKLKQLMVSYNNIESIDVSGCIILEDIDLTKNQLAKLDLSSCNLLKRVDVGGNKLESLIIKNADMLEWLNCSDNKLTTLDLSNFNAFKYLNCGDV
jgi:serine/threonine protein kinase